MTKPEIVSSGSATVFSGKEAVDVFRATVIAGALELYAKTGMRANRAYTPKAMMQAAQEMTGETFKARDYAHAAVTLRQWATNQSAAIRAGNV